MNNPHHTTHLHHSNPCNNCTDPYHMCHVHCNYSHICYPHYICDDRKHFGLSRDLEHKSGLMWEHLKADQKVAMKVAWKAEMMVDLLVESLAERMVDH